MKLSDVIKIMKKYLNKDKQVVQVCEEYIKLIKTVNKYLKEAKNE